MLAPHFHIAPKAFKGVWSAGMSPVRTCPIRLYMKQHADPSFGAVAACRHFVSPAQCLLRHFPKNVFYRKPQLWYTHSDGRLSHSRASDFYPKGRPPMSQVTKRALEQSLKNLLLKKPLTKITISDIAEDCGINRMTFYYHFKDIYDLVEWSCLEDARRALDEKKTHDTWQQGLLQIFEAVQENKPFILNVYRCVHREQVEKYLTPLVDDLLLGVIQEESAGMAVRDEDKQFIAQIYSYIFIGVMLDWIKDDMREEPPLLVDRLARLMTGSMTAALSRFKL